MSDPPTPNANALPDQNPIPTLLHVQRQALCSQRCALLHHNLVSLPALLKPIPLAGTINRVPNVCSRDRQTKQYKLEQEPAPASAALLLPDHAATRLSFGAARVALQVQILRAHADDVVVVGELTSFGGETEVGHGRHLEILDLKALGPFVFLLVLEVELERFVGKVRETSFGRDSGIADTSSLSIISMCLFSLLIQTCMED